MSKDDSFAKRAGSPSDSFSKLRRAVRNNSYRTNSSRDVGAAIMHQVALQPVDLKPQGYDKLVIHPSNRLKQAFDQVVALTIVYSVIIAPFAISILLIFDNLADKHLKGGNAHI